ncbi:Sec-independent protein translocase subunit TatA [Marinicella sediminis]|uniref:Sec-independent protein translocase protein TatA n=1 Tax=Marinicella sediminis TaxID=1792834 RepID=A0ABV7JCK1_9GAMM|nr:Sec-independent protein translocase subunit TatA [Marinicella sediminis]
MGFGLKELVVILIIVALLFGTKKLKNIGSDLGGAIKGFKKGIAEEEPQELDDQSKTDEVKATQAEEKVSK